MDLQEFNTLSREQQREAFRTLPADQQREVMADMNRQVRDRIRETIHQMRLESEFESSLVPQIAFKSAPPNPEYPEAPPLRQGIDQEEYVRRIFRSDPGIKELRTADGNIYTRK